MVDQPEAVVPQQQDAAVAVVQLAMPQQDEIILPHHEVAAVIDVHEDDIQHLQGMVLDLGIYMPRDQASAAEVANTSGEGTEN